MLFRSKDAANNDNLVSNTYSVAFSSPNPTCVVTAARSAFNTSPITFTITFSDPVDPRSVSADKAQVRVWGLKRSANYGSPHVNEHPLAVKEATVGADGRTVRLRVEGMAPTWGMEIAYSFAGTDGKPVAGRIHNTVHALAGGSKP